LYNQHSVILEADINGNKIKRSSQLHEELLNSYLEFAIHKESKSALKHAKKAGMIRQ